MSDEHERDECWKPCPVCGEDYCPSSDPCLDHLASELKVLQERLNDADQMLFEVLQEPPPRDLLLRHIKEYLAEYDLEASD